MEKHVQAATCRNFPKIKNTVRKRSRNLFVTLCAFASYTSVVQAEVMLGASLPNDGFSRQVIADFNNVSPKKLAYVNVYSAFSHDWDNLYWQSSNVVAEGATPMITWMPVDLARQNDNLLPEIVLGYWDDYLSEWGTKLIAWVNMYPESERPRLAIRFGHEFNGNWYPYSNTPISYKAAWQHIHDLFETMGVNEHVDWVWSASKTNVDDYNDFTVYYPGDEYVDWTSLDGYNWGSNYTSQGWTSFKDVFASSYEVMVSNYPSKPIMIGETASAEPSDLPNPDYGMYGDDTDAFESKSVWIKNMLSDLETTFPAVRALSIFNINKELSWSMSTAYNTGLDGWIDGTQSAHFTSDLLVASALDGAPPTAEKPPKGKGNNKGKGRDKKQSSLTFQEDDVTPIGSSITVRQISQRKQSQFAHAVRSSGVDNAYNRHLANALENMAHEDKFKFNQMKLSVLDY